MWSRKPIPVHIHICCEDEVCEACVSSVWSGIGTKEYEELVEVVELGKCSESGRRSSGPPSRERDNWILVSLVFRAMKAVRGASEGGIRERWEARRRERYVYK